MDLDCTMCYYIFSTNREGGIYMDGPSYNGPEPSLLTMIAQFIFAILGAIALLLGVGFILSFTPLGVLIGLILIVIGGGVVCRSILSF